MSALPLTWSLVTLWENGHLSIKSQEKGLGFTSLNIFDHLCTPFLLAIKRTNLFMRCLRYLEGGFRGPLSKKNIWHVDMNDQVRSKEKRSLKNPPLVLFSLLQSLIETLAIMDFLLWKTLPYSVFVSGASRWRNRALEHLHIVPNKGFPPLFVLLILHAQVTTSYQTSTSIWLLYKNGTFQVASGEVMRGGDGMEVIMATETTKVKKMDDNGTVKGKEYSKRALGGLGNRERLKSRKQVRKHGVEQAQQKIKRAIQLGGCVCVSAQIWKRKPLTGTIGVNVWRCGWKWNTHTHRQDKHTSPKTCQKRETDLDIDAQKGSKRRKIKNQGLWRARQWAETRHL